MSIVYNNWMCVCIVINLMYVTTYSIECIYGCVIYKCMYVCMCV